MTNYRRAFFLAGIANFVLLALLIGSWWYSRVEHTKKQPAASASSPVEQPVQGEAPGSATAPSQTPLVPVQLSAERLQSIGVKFGVVERKPIQDEVRTTGTVAMDETRLSYVQTRFSGYIVKVFADATYKYVRKGQPLFTIYSPELAAAEREYLVAKRNAQGLAQSTVPGVAAGITSLVNASTDRLRQWNLPPREIARLESSGQVQEELEINSPVSGYITERNALPNLTVQPDTRLYTIADLSTVWVLAQVFQNDLGHVRAGEPATLTVDSYPGRTFRGRVDFIYPDVDLTTRTARVRLIFSNPNLALTPGMFVNVTLQVPLGNQLVIPTSGVLQSGTRQIVFVDRGAGYLEPRDVQLGAQAGDEYIILKGLKSGERIVTSANFLIDSESQLQAAIGSFVPPPPGAGAAAAMNGPGTQPTVAIDFSTDPATPRKGTNLYRVKLTASDGSPISGAQVSVRSFMPAMPQMGMAAINIATPLAEIGSGLYEGHVDLESGGTWKLTVAALKNGAVLATKQISLNAEGGN
ncbi:MAG TPA: efflux RND transporter periplasmic adaptor subunit [Candidatus Acidoferrum sp.]|nr:efflux RND transporter periplasmic adaptor subunit [Candidatus Acidoferrum sp.]